MKIHKFLLVIHRWFGLVMALFMVLVGLTGSILALRPQLDRLLTPERYAKPRPGVAPLDLNTLVDRVQSLVPPGKEVSLVGIEPDRVRVGIAPPALTLSTEVLEQRLGMSLQQIREMGFFTRLLKMAEMRGKLRDLLSSDDLSTVFLDPWTGKEIARTGGDKSFMSFIYVLHYSLNIPMGKRILGIIALIWTLDCFVAFCLTLPPRLRSAAGTSPTTLSWWARWKPAWLLKTNAGPYRLNLDLHRASGLWLWAILFVFAWSSVMFNLQSVYAPVTRALFGYESSKDINARRPRSIPDSGPPPSLHEMLATGQRLAAAEGASRRLVVGAPIAVMTIPPALVRVILRSDNPSCQSSLSTDHCLVLEFGSQTGQVTSFRAAKQNAYFGNDVSDWLKKLHVAYPLGIAYQIFVFFLGLVIAMLSVTGVYLWWKKRSIRRGRRKGGERGAVPAAGVGAMEAGS